MVVTCRTGYFWTLLTQIQLKLVKIEHQQDAKLGQESPQRSHFTDGKTEATGQSNWPTLVGAKLRFPEHLMYIPIRNTYDTHVYVYWREVAF